MIHDLPVPYAKKDKLCYKNYSASNHYYVASSMLHIYFYNRK